MRFALLAVAFFAASGSVQAEVVTPNHLDCNFNETANALVCPSIPMPSGRSSAEPAPVAAPPAVEGGSAKPEKGSAEWNAHCAAKYRSFDAATGMYKSYSGKIKPCV
jgi:BA14K-like protein